MAHDDTEIEIKLRLDKELFQKVKDRLSSMAEFRKTSHQVDEYFTPQHRDFLNYDYPYEWLRIGQRDGRTILNYKHFYPENTMPFSHCDEFETEISCPERLRKIFSAVDMKPLVTVDKQSETFIYNDEIEIVLDTVKGLGHFMEIEALKHLESIDATRKMLLDFAEGLGLDPAKTVERGYPYLLMDRRGMLQRGS